MADNVAFTVTGATYTAATDKVTYSADANVDVQLVKLVGTTGSEGSKTVTEVMGTAGSPGTAVLTIQGVGSGTAVPVSGTVAATQSGTWTVQPGNTANTTAWLVTGTGGTFPATQSGNWSTRTQDGSGNALTSKSVGSDRALSIAVVDASGNQITSFGGSAGVVSAHHFVSAASDNAASVKASAGTLRGLSLFSTAAAPVYLKFHNTAGTPTAGSGVVRTFGIQAGQRLDLTFPGGGVSFATGIGITCVTGAADNGTGNTTASTVTGEIFYE